MEVKEGYKLTEIGVIPKDWESLQLKNIVDRFLNGGTPSTTNNSFWEGNIPWITGADFTNQSVQEIRRYISQEAVKKSSTNVIKKGNLIIVTRTGVGKMTIAPFDIAISQDITGLYLSKSNDVSYLFYYLDYNSENFKALNQGTSIAGITRETLSSIKIATPPSKQEQTAIAKVLSDTDALIQSLERLIAKKQSIKQGTMQLLLTGKKRLPDFSGEWELKKLGEIGKTYGGLSGKSKKDFENGKYPYIPFMNVMQGPIIDTNYFDYVHIGQNENQSRVLKGDLIFNGSSETPEEVGMCSAMQKEVPNLYLNSFCFGFRVNKSNIGNSLFLSYLFRSNVGRQLIYSLAQGATRYNLSKNNFLKLKVPQPTFEEQTAIAKVLSNMDNELTALENKLHKYKQLKQGVMQNLLTGKIRLV